MREKAMLFWVDMSGVSPIANKQPLVGEIRFRERIRIPE